MAIYFHFLRRDLRDSAPSWIAAFVLIGAAVAANGIYDFERTVSASVLYFFGLGVCLMGISHPHCRGIWGGKSAAPVARTYLKGLPLPRRTAFGLCFARGIPGDLPIALYLLWVLPHFNVLPTLASRIRGFPILPRSAHLSEYFLCLALSLIFIVYSQLSSATYGLLQDGINRTNDRRKRLLNFFATLGLGACLPSVQAAGVGWILFCSFFELPLNGFGQVSALLAVPATAAQFYWLYRNWLWT